MVPNWNVAREGREKFELLLDSLRASNKLNFYLTGSRYFGGATISSDWDFFVQDSKEAQDFLNFAKFNYGPIFVSKHTSILLLPSTWSRLFLNLRLLEATLLNFPTLTTTVRKFGGGSTWISRLLLMSSSN